MYDSCQNITHDTVHKQLQQVTGCCQEIMCKWFQTLHVTTKKRRSVFIIIWLYVIISLRKLPLMVPRSVKGFKMLSFALLLVTHPLLPHKTQRYAVADRLVSLQWPLLSWREAWMWCREGGKKKKWDKEIRGQWRKECWKRAGSVR